MGGKTVQVKMKWSFQGEVEFRNWANRLGCDWDIMQLSKLKKIKHSKMLSRCFRSISRIPGNLIPNTISHYTPKPQNNIPSHRTTTIFTFVPHTIPFLVRSVVSILDPAARFDEMIIGPQRKYYFLGGKGGVGKTSCAASLAVKFADHGHPSIVISTDLAHSLRNLVSIDGLNSPLLALEINPDKAKEEFQSASQKNGGSAVKDFMNNMGLGMLADQFWFLESNLKISNDIETFISSLVGGSKLGELLDTPPPGLDEAIAISKAWEDLLTIAADQPFRFPATFTFVVRSFSVLDGIRKGLDPLFDIIEIAKPYALELLRFREAGVEVALKDFRKIWDRQPRAFYNLFGQADRVEKVAETIQRLEQGDLKLRMQTLKAERAFQRVDVVQKTIGRHSRELRK
ncbi:hypothetical protein F3Y22_tig00109908pilonHSYRG00038 [Hibiscus syriacus]|uniref:ArsA/GET3 Anion-transporting ATPase-like domain-containing protein n=1 Tax=Hibiscus syriacus TaxID=106335 RepID=A0A6A3BW94_HIBSY|nr:hypothetical protein F3Y22_tig00109908pilonHSYRG00038 [Hibiscus syriacus]